MSTLQPARDHSRRKPQLTEEAPGAVLTWLARSPVLLLQGLGSIQTPDVRCLLGGRVVSRAVVLMSQDLLEENRDTFASVVKLCS